ncbi:MAG TPA: TOBE domain-containing protein [Chthoniobacterales bacterium]|jgi:molybdate transport system regulatory protein
MAQTNKKPRRAKAAPRREESIRNRIPGVVRSILSDKVVSEVVVETKSGEIASIITTRSLQEMKLQPGDKVFVMVKATHAFLQKKA